MAFAFPNISIKRGTPITVVAPKGTQLKPGQIRAVTTPRPPPAPQIRLRPPAPGAIQGFINKWTGATPEQPIRLPFRYGDVEVKADKTTQNLLLALAGVGLLGVIVYANR